MIFSKTCNICQVLYKRKNDHALHGTGLCDECFENEYNKVKINKTNANQQAKEDLIKQVLLVENLLKPDQNPLACLKANHKMMKLFVKYVETITSL